MKANLELKKLLEILKSIMIYFDLKIVFFRSLAFIILATTAMYSYLVEGVTFAFILIIFSAIVASCTIRKYAGIFLAVVFVVEIPLLFLEIHTSLYQTLDSIIVRIVLYCVTYLYLRYLKGVESQHSKELKNLRHTHESTRIKNHKSLMQDVKTNLARKNCGSINIIVIHFKNMKNLNFHWGYDYGSEVLVVLRNRLSLYFEKSRIYQLSNDDLAIYTERDHEYYTMDIVETLFKPIDIHGNSYEIIGNIGVSTYPLHTNSIKRCIDNAQFAAHESEGLRNINVFSPMTNDNAKRRVLILNKLKTAIRNNLLELYFQPQCDIRTGVIIGWEALLRWTDDDLGVISPVEIVEIAEEWNLIDELSTWVVKNSIEQLKYWRNHKISTKLSVNLSWKNIENSSFVNWMVKYIEESNLPPNSLCIEITETALHTKSNDLLDSLNKFSSNKIPTSLDDFGTGYNNLDNLVDISLAQIKIDRGFIQGRDKKKEQIIGSLIELAHLMKVEVVAEGVETKEDYEFIKSLNCDYSQGYYHAKPMPQSETLLYMKQHAGRQLNTEHKKGDCRKLSKNGLIPVISEQ